MHMHVFAYGCHPVMLTYDIDPHCTSTTDVGTSMTDAWSTSTTNVAGTLACLTIDWSFACRQPEYRLSSIVAMNPSIMVILRSCCTFASYITSYSIRNPCKLVHDPCRGTESCYVCVYIAYTCMGMHACVDMHACM